MRGRQRERNREMEIERGREIDEERKREMCYESQTLESAEREAGHTCCDQLNIP